MPKQPASKTRPRTLPKSATKGTPTKFDATKQEAFIAFVRAGARRTQAARAVGVDPSTVRKFAMGSPDFAIEVSEAEIEANDVIEDALFKTAKAGNVTAILAWLYSRDPERWKDQRGRGAEEAANAGGMDADAARQTIANALGCKPEEVVGLLAKMRSGKVTEITSAKSKRRKTG